MIICRESVDQIEKRAYDAHFSRQLSFVLNEQSLKANRNELSTRRGVNNLSKTNDRFKFSIVQTVLNALTFFVLKIGRFDNKSKSNELLLLVHFCCHLVIVVRCASR